MRCSIVIGLIALASFSLCGQSFWFGPKLGGGLGFQNWGNSSQPNPLFVPNADIFIESYSEDNKGSLYAVLGYHVRGSAIRAFSWNGEFFSNQGFKFRNAALELGLKKPLNTKFGSSTPYYLFGLRGEYMLSNNLAQYERFNNYFYPSKELVRKMTYGVSVGGGFEFQLGEMSQAFVELAFMPDLADQYYQQPLNNVIDPWTLQKINLEERRIRNVSFEVKVGLKLLRKVVYQ